MNHWRSKGEHTARTYFPIYNWKLKESPTDRADAEHGTSGSLPSSVAVVVGNVEVEVVLERPHALGRRPSLPGHPRQIGPDLGAGVVESEQGIEWLFALLLRRLLLLLFLLRPPSNVHLVFGLR